MIGIVVADTAFGEKNQIIFNDLNKTVEKIGEANLVYVNLSSQIMHADFAIMNITEINNYYGGTLVATCPMTADIVAKATVNAKKIWYMFDLGFLMRSYGFKETFNLLKKITPVVRSDAHAQFIKNLFGITPQIMPTFEVKELWK